MSSSCNHASLLALVLAVSLPPQVFAQRETIKPEPSLAGAAGPPLQSGRVPESIDPDDDSIRWNTSLGVTSIHTSNTGWATLATPTFGYRFDDIFSVDAVIPIYFFRLAESRSARPRPNAILINQRGELGDFILSGHAQFPTSTVNYELTGAVTAPTGDEAYGLTTGRATFDINNQFTRTLGRVTPTLDIGAGDSSTLVNRLVTKNYTSLGPLGHFQIGMVTQITGRASFTADAYEQLPIGDQKIYTSKISRNTTTTVVTGHNVTEDNGIDAAFDLTIDQHTVFSSYYSRSLRLRTDTMAVGLTYFLRATAPAADGSSIDDLIR